MQTENNVSMEFSFNYQEEKSSLDVLLELIQKKKKDIRDINIKELTTQFLEYVDQNKDHLPLEVYSDYANMSAYLIELKTRSLLPDFDDNGNKYKRSLEEERELFIKRLLEHQMYKNVIPMLENFKTKRNLHFDKEPEDFDDYLPISVPMEKLPKKIDVAKLSQAFESLLNRQYLKTQLQKPIDLHMVNNEYSVNEVIVDLITYLENYKQGIYLSDFFNNLDINKKNIDYYCMLFFVILSLIHRDNVIFQEKNDDIYIQLNLNNFSDNSVSQEFIDAIKRDLDGE